MYGERVSFIITGTNFTGNSGYGGGDVAGRYSSFSITTVRATSSETLSQIRVGQFGEF